MAKFDKEPSYGEVVKLKISLKSLFDGYFMHSILSIEDENLYMEKRNEFILMYANTLFSLFKNKNKEYCQIYYQTPWEILLPHNENFMKSLIIDENPTARIWYKRIESFLGDFSNCISTRARKENVESELYAFIREGEHSNKNDLNNGEEIKKIDWIGTPGEFGTIMNELIIKGFIPKVKDQKSTVRLLSKVFQVRNEKGELVDETYLYKCFGEKKKAYYHSEFKIPFSDNSDKNK